MTDSLPPTLPPVVGGADATNPGPGLRRLMALPAWAALRSWQEPHRAIAIRATARRLGAGVHPDWALWGGMLEATQHHLEGPSRPPR
jgi:hypothetical protein